MIAVQIAAPPRTRASAASAGASRAGQHQPDEEGDAEGRARETAVIEPEQRRALGDDEERDQRGGEEREREGDGHFTPPSARARASAPPSCAVRGPP